MAHSQGQHVEYRDQNNQKQKGVILDVQGAGANAQYTIQNDKTQQREQLPESKIDREL